MALAKEVALELRSGCSAVQDVSESSSSSSNTSAKETTLSPRQGSSITSTGEVTSEPCSSAPAMGSVSGSFPDSAIDLTKKSAAEPRPNFPLPRELRDQIYGYLLNHEHVHAPPYHTRPQQDRGTQSEATNRDRSVAHTYRFSTVILAVNKEIQREAQEALCDSNTFVIVSWVWPDLGQTLHAYDLPIHPVAKPAPKHEWILMLHSDLAILCRTIRYVSVIPPKPGKIVLKPVDALDHELLMFERSDGRAVITKIQFMENRDHVSREDAMAKQVQFKVLDAVTSDINCAFERYLREMAFLASPPLVRISALAWDMLDISLVLLEEAHELCRAGDLARARRHYESVYAAGAVMLDFPSLAFSSDAELPLVLTMRVYADAAAAAGLLYLRDVDYLKAHAAGKHALFGETGSGHPEASGAAKTPEWHLHLIMNIIHRSNLDTTVARLEIAKAEQPSNAHVAHDLRLAQRGTTILDHVKEDLRETSAVCLAPQIFQFVPPKHNERPKELRGWCDLKQRQAAIVAKGPITQAAEQEGKYELINPR
ncbi:hypothetical protein B0A50_03400 [Salinomyces thailandicus]|uniref:Uncharacterized protein n=1 Tax=Salinomyces thailandicus TaxID=706561 RepID=A0A4U0U284_9PEZI|nr:hypothetical protein B0A50_03400 [Salinomyces thailandica]